MVKISDLKFDQLELDADPTRLKIPSRDKAAKFIERVTNAKFLNQIGVTAIRRADPTTIAMEAQSSRLVIHVDGSFHIQFRNARIEEILALERVGKLFVDAAIAVHGSQKFDLEFELHHFFEEKEIISRIAEVLKRAGSKLVMREIHPVDIHYLNFGIGPSLEIGFGEHGHFDVYYEPESINIGDMKEKYLLAHVQHAVAAALAELGKNHGN